MNARGTAMACHFHAIALIYVVFGNWRFRNYRTQSTLKCSVTSNVETYYVTIFYCYIPTLSELRDGFDICGIQYFRYIWV